MKIIFKKTFKIAVFYLIVTVMIIIACVKRNELYDDVYHERQNNLTKLNRRKRK